MTPGDPGPNPRWRRHVATFLAGQTVSLFGSMLVQYAVFWYVAITFKSGVMMTLTLVFGFLPQAVVSIFAGVWADRMSRKRMIIAADATIALATLGLSVLLLMGVTDPWIIFATLAIRSAGAGVQTPAVSALIPQITPAAHLMRVNGSLSSLQSALALLGPPVAAGLYATAAAASGGTVLALLPIFAIDIVTAAIGILLLATIPVGVVRAADVAVGYFDDLVEGVRYVATHPFVRWLLIVYAIVFLLTVAPADLTPVMLVRSFPSGEQGDVLNLALLEMAFSVGMVGGGVVVATLAARWNRIALIAGASLVFGVLAIALGLAPTLWVFLGVMLLIGFVVPFFSTPSMTLIQETVEPDRQGRVFGFVGIVMAVAAPVGMLVFGPLADVIPIEWILIGSGIATFVVIGLALGLPAGRRAVAAANAASAAAGTVSASVAASPQAGAAPPAPATASTTGPASRQDSGPPSP